MSRRRADGNERFYLRRDWPEKTPTESSAVRAQPANPAPPALISTTCSIPNSENLLLMSQQTTLPSVRIPQVWPPPASIAVNRWSGGGKGGRYRPSTEANLVRFSLSPLK